MLKIVKLGSWDGPGFDVPVRLIKVSSRGLIGNDRRDFLKTASHVFADAIDGMKIASGEIPIHMNAIGATEGYGCFVAGTPVRMDDGSLRPIELVEVGEEVVDRNGNYGKVAAWFKRPYDGGGATLRIEGIDVPIVCTELHQFLVVAASETKPRWIEAKDIKPGDTALVVPVGVRGWQRHCRVQSVELHPLKTDVYNLEVRDSHTYTVGNGVVVHNSNRNGDGFTEKTCKACHQRFVKDAKFYRNHQNTDPLKSFGYVKLSAYNDGMRRIELLVMGNVTKEAADRNKGLVMDPKSVDKLQRGELLGVSMATKVAFDVCCNCDNRAPSRNFYCDSDTCISSETGRRGFGCKSGLSKVASDGFQQYVDNPDPFFFDISEVIRPADRTAWGGMADYLTTKAASSGYVPGGAELAELYLQQSPACSLFQSPSAEHVKLAAELAEIERRIEAGVDRNMLRGVHVAALDASVLGEPGTAKFASALGALSREGIFLNVPDFLSLLGVPEEKLAMCAAGVSACLPGIYQRLEGDPNLEYMLQHSPFAPSAELPLREHRDYACKMASVGSLEAEAVRDRIYRSAIAGAAAPAFRSSTGSARFEPAARQYAAYKLAAIAMVPHLKFAAVLQHYSN